MTDYVELILNGLYATENEFGVSMSYEKWVKVIFEDEQTKTFRNFVAFNFYGEDDKKAMGAYLRKKDCDLKLFLKTWIHDIELSGFSFATVCCKDVFVLEPRVRNEKGVKELDDFRQSLDAKGLLGRHQFGVVLKECRCT